ncbi:hypothetical protein GALL_426970 [mine drainage metagenome]|uniref:Uncharacterized protein n=1 Tax=mine drainage metagenome TaxID=410659 RepID=A0A1J5PX62_9ZZZZ
MLECRRAGARAGRRAGRALWCGDRARRDQRLHARGQRALLLQPARRRVAAALRAVSAARRDGRLPAARWPARRAARSRRLVRAARRTATAGGFGSAGRPGRAARAVHAPEGQTAGRGPVRRRTQARASRPSSRGGHRHLASGRRAARRAVDLAPAQPATAHRALPGQRAGRRGSGRAGAGAADRGTPRRSRPAAAGARRRRAGGLVGVQRRGAGAGDRRVAAAGGQRGRARNRFHHRRFRRGPARGHTDRGGRAVRAGATRPAAAVAAGHDALARRRGAGAGAYLGAGAY